APRQAARARQRTAAAHVELLDQPPRELDEPAREEPAETRDRSARVVVEAAVLRDRELEDEAAALAVLRDVPEARVEHLARAGVRDVAAGDRDPPPARLAQPRERVDQLALPVAVDARDTDHLPPAAGG